MEYNVQIDDMQEDKFIRPIFEAIIANVNDELLIKIYFDTNIRQFSNYLPDRVFSNTQFIKKAIDLNLLDYSRVPEQFKNTDFITHEEYLKLKKARAIGPTDNLYPHDKDTVLAGIKGAYSFDVIPEEFKNDIPFLVDCVKTEHRFFYYLPQSHKDTILDNKDYLKSILNEQKEFFDYLPDNLKKDKDVLKVMLSNKEGYKILRYNEAIRKITDSDLVLDALKINPDIKLIHQKFSSIIKKHDAKGDPYNFLKTYLVMQSLDKGLSNEPKKQNTPKI